MSGVPLMMINKRACQFIRVWLIFSLPFLAASGCAPSYKAPNLPDSEVATVVVDGPLWIVAVDALSTASIFQTTGQKTVVLAPGKHAIKARYNRNGLMAEGSLELDATAGKRYVLRATLRGYAVTFCLEQE
jgi:hypothetical protein